MILLLMIQLQDVDELRRRVEAGGQAVYGLEQSRILDLEITVRGAWGALDLADFNRRAYWRHDGKAPRSWSSGQPIRGLTEQDRAVRATMDRVVWSFLSNRADDQALAQWDKVTREHEGELDKISWTHPRVEDAAYARWFDAAGRIVRAQGTTLTFDDGTLADKSVWDDAYVYEGDVLKTIRLESGELTAEWSDVKGGKLPAKIRGTLKGVGDVEIDLSERAIGEGRAAAAMGEK